ncbi:hypothetical protein BD769DRAFT_1387660 [Suillus cothurnatus]|nr:hypothetical protein BD769DRAFT_1387660 [Suillus cothurnatus]
MFVEAVMVGNQTRIKQRKTATGIKDTFLKLFLDYLAQPYSKIHGGNNTKQEALNRVKETLPANVISPVWQVLESAISMATPLFSMRDFLLVMIFMLLHRLHPLSSMT